MEGNNTVQSWILIKSRQEAGCEPIDCSAGSSCAHQVGQDFILSVGPHNSLTCFRYQGLLMELPFNPPEQDIYW